MAERTIYQENTEIKTRTLRSISDLSGAVIELMEGDANGLIWYRGHNCVSWLLSPRIKRPPLTEAEEQYLAVRFRAEAVGRHAHCPGDDDYANWLVLMQHYGLPTRLLDWSSSPLIGAFFAVGYGNEKDPSYGDACIWVLAPVKLNLMQVGVDWIIHLSSKGLEPLVQKAFGVPYDEMDELRSDIVLAGYAPHIDPRLMAQSGYFTIHGENQPLETLQGCEAFLEKWIIPAEYKDSMARELRYLGIRQANVFPDLANLAEDLRDNAIRSALRSHST